MYFYFCVACREYEGRAAHNNYLLTNPLVSFCAAPAPPTNRMSEARQPPISNYFGVATGKIPEAPAKKRASLKVSGGAAPKCTAAVKGVRSGTETQRTTLQARPKEQKEKKAHGTQTKKVANGSSPPLTKEQTRIVHCELLLQPQDFIVVNAYAGSGKTLTLQEFVRGHPRKRFLYLVYNKSTREDAKRRLDGLPNLASQDIHTYHSLAYRTFQGEYQLLAQDYKYKQQLQQWWENRKASPSTIRVPDSTDHQHHTAFWDEVMRKLREFCVSDRLQVTIKDPVFAADIGAGAAAREREPEHEHKTSADDDDDAQDAFASSASAAAAPYDASDVDACVQELVTATVDLRIGCTSFEMMLKLLQLKKCVFGEYQVVALDEAQDIMPVVTAILLQQLHCALVVVGDERQQINQWTGAINAMTNLEPHFPKAQTRHYTLSRTHRFSQNVCAFVNRLLGVTGCELAIPLRSNVKNATTSVHESSVHRVIELALEARARRKKEVANVRSPAPPAHVAVVTRTKRLAVRHLLQLAIGRAVPGLTIGCCSSLRYAIERCIRLAKMTDQNLVRVLQRAKASNNVEQVTDILIIQTLAKSTAGGRAQVAADLTRLLAKVGTDPNADIDIYTAHSAKGKEWLSVMVGEDFDESFSRLQAQNGGYEQAGAFVPWLSDSDCGNQEVTGAGDGTDKQKQDQCCLYVAVTRARCVLLLPPKLYALYVES